MATFTILEPISTGDLIDRAVRLYRRNFTPLVGITAVPSLIGYVVSLLFWSGYAGLISSASGSRGVSFNYVWMLMLGALGYPLWLYALLLTIAGLSRVVGDNVMLGQQITLRRCFAAVKGRLGAITLMGLLSIAMLLMVYFVVTIVMFIVIMAVSLTVAAIAAAGLPQWVATTALIVVVIVAVAAILLVVLTIVGRLVFMPQIVMIEGQSAGNALGRSITLGKGNWYKVGAIALFAYFVSLSLLAALSLPVLVGLYLSGMLTPEFFVSPTWSILYTSFGQIANLLSLPIWIVSFTLLYFDSRVRKEAYDLDLIAREINPGFYWQPPVQPGAFGYQFPAQSLQDRQVVQTSPLGLAGPPRPRTTQVEPIDDRSRGDDNLVSKEQSVDGSVSEEAHLQPVSAKTETSAATCVWCGAVLMTGASFCTNCGSVTR